MTRIGNMLLSLAIGLLLGGAAHAESITVSAAISLKEALTGIADRYGKQTGHEVQMNFGASGQLAVQIENGAPVDLFISAAQAQVDQLVARKLVDPTAVRVVAGNELVLVVPAGATNVPAKLNDIVDPVYGKIAIGNPRFVPAGLYAMEALRASQLDVVEARLIQAASVRQVLDYVERGDVSVGFVYRTDARQSGEKVKVALAIPSNLHAPIVYPAAVIRESRGAGLAAEFLQFLRGRDAQTLLRDKGFAAAPISPTSRPADAP